MDRFSVEINTGGGYLDIKGGAIGVKNNIKFTGNQFGDDSDGNNELLIALEELCSELKKVKDLPEDDLIDLNINVDLAVQSIRRESPNIKRMMQKLQLMSNTLDQFGNSVSSAMILGSMIKKIISMAQVML